MFRPSGKVTYRNVTLSAWSISRRIVGSRALSSSDEVSESKKDAKKMLVWTVGKNPIVEQLWSMRHEEKERAKRSGGLDGVTCDLTKGGKINRTPSHSETSIDYSFSTDELLMEGYKNPWGMLTG